MVHFSAGAGAGDLQSAGFLGAVFVPDASFALCGLLMR
jgi:hypothetical protein